MGEAFKASLYPYDELQKRVLAGGGGGGGGGEPAVTSVNNMTGDVVITAADVGADSAGSAAKAKSEAITAAAADATEKANSAKSGAITTAATDATTKANAAKSDAITAAGTNADSKISTHNSSTTAHSDIRNTIAALKSVLDEFFAEGADNDNNLDRLVEIVTLINSNKSAIDTIATNKANKIDVVNKSDIVNALTSEETQKPLSAAQGKALKALIDALNNSKLNSSDLTSAINTALAQAKSSGEFDGEDGEKGDDGVGISNIAKTGTSGKVDTYTITLTNGTTATFTVTNGKDGNDGAPGYTPVYGKDYFTEADINNIVTRVHDSIGTPLFGVIDENNHITFSGRNIPDATYTWDYETETGEKVPGGTFVLDTNVYYSVTKTLTYCTISNSATKVVKDEPYTATITANSGYELKSVTVTMGGSPVSVSGGVINIASVTGNIVISAVAEEAEDEDYNLADPTSDEWLEGYKITTSGGVEKSDGVTTVNTIYATVGDIVSIKGMTNIIVGLYKNGEWYSRKTVNTTNFGTKDTIIDGDYTRFKPSYACPDLTAIRFYGMLSGTAEDVIITVNHEII